MKKAAKFFAFILLIVVILSVSLWFYANNSLNQKLDVNEDIKIEIPKGTSINGAVELLGEKVDINPNRLYKYYAKYYAKITGKHIYAGLYKIDHNITKKELIEALFDEDNLWTVKVTFPEGVSYTKFAEIAENKIGINKKEFLRLCRSDSLLKSRNINAKSLEGYLMPDTYTFFMESGAGYIINVLLDNHFDFIDKFYSEISSSRLNHHELITLASIIEAETPVADERKTVSGLYHNRLRKQWQLQADPTVQYAIGEKRRLLYKDLKKMHPYNTYMISGLPPGPINNPGRASIEAAIFPEQHDYMYMVAVGDGSGKHNFGKDFSDHQKNIRIFRKNAR